MKVHIIALFPEYFVGPFSCGILGRAVRNGTVSLEAIDLRSFGEGRHCKVDDRPYGGGAGMVLKPGPVVAAIESVKQDSSHVILFSPQGKQFTSEDAHRLSSHQHLVLVCGQYEGVDERVGSFVHEEFSIGDFVVMSGHVAALVVIEATARFVPGVLGNPNSVEDQYIPQYTRPYDFRGLVVPNELLSGNHQQIANWRRQNTRKRSKG